MCNMIQTVSEWVMVSYIPIQRRLGPVLVVKEANTIGKNFPFQYEIMYGF